MKRVYFDPEAIGQRTRAKIQKSESDEGGDYLMPVVNDTVIFCYKPKHDNAHRRNQCFHLNLFYFPIIITPWEALHYS